MAHSSRRMAIPYGPSGGTASGGMGYGKAYQHSPQPALPLRNAGLQPEQLYVRYYLKLGSTKCAGIRTSSRSSMARVASSLAWPTLAKMVILEVVSVGFRGEPQLWSHRAGFRMWGCYGNHV